jgi:hypothetical protein
VSQVLGEKTWGSVERGVTRTSYCETAYGAIWRALDRAAMMTAPRTDRRATAAIRRHSPIPARPSTPVPPPAIAP